MEVRLTLQKFAENSSHRFPRVSRHGYRGDQAGNGRKWPKMTVRLKWKKFAENSSHRFPRVLRSGHRGRKKEVRLKMAKMVENGRKWISAGKWQKMDFRVFRVISLLLADSTQKNH